METGHAKNVANFKKMIQLCTGFGLVYNPSGASLKIPAMSLKFTACDTVVKAVEPLKKPYKDGIDARKADAGFGNLNNITRSALAILKSCDGVSDTTINDANTLCKVITGSNRAPKAATPTTPPVTPEPTPASHSTSQQSFDKRLSNFHDFVAILAGEPLYISNEADTKVPALKTYAINLTTLNEAVAVVFQPYEESLKDRDIELYFKETGLTDIAAKVKSYVKGITALSKTDKKLIADLTFTTPPKKSLHF